MAIQKQSQTASAPRGFRAHQVYGMSVAFLLLGLGLGYFSFGKNPASSVAGLRGSADLPIPRNAPTNSGVHPALTMDQMKQMADLQASTLIEKSKAEPRNASLLTQIAAIYQGAHRFKEAADYYGKALSIDPRDVTARTQMASCLFYNGDVDEALHQLELTLKTDPKNVNALFNLGMIKYKGKNDAAGAIAAWQELLKNNPNLERKPIVESMLAEAKAASAAGK